MVAASVQEQTLRPNPPRLGCFSAPIEYKFFQIELAFEPFIRWLEIFDLCNKIDALPRTYHTRIIDKAIVQLVYNASPRINGTRWRNMSLVCDFDLSTGKTLISMTVLSPLLISNTRPLSL